MKALLLLTLMAAVSATQNCSHLCSFLYYNPTPNTSSTDTTSFFINTTAVNITGIVTADFNFFSPVLDDKAWDYLRFAKTSDLVDQSLVFRFFNNDADKNTELFGRSDGANYGISEANIALPINVQISDLNSIADEFYTMYLGVPGAATYTEYNYGSSTYWYLFSDKRLSDVVDIRSEGRTTVYNFISLCEHATPQLCDSNATETVSADIGTAYTLTCSASGAPYMAATWANVTFRETGEIALEEYDNTTADNFILSEVYITSFTVDHIGSWSCTVLNKNFGDSVTKVYTLAYSANVSVVSSPSDWYVANEGDATFVWAVQGWPLDLVTLNCSNTNFSLAYNTSSWYSESTPQQSLSVTFSNGTASDQINCTLYNNGSVLNTTYITRVGYNCQEGEQGVGKSCEVCPKGETSAEGVGICYNVTSTCSDGEYGIGEDCTVCPTGEVSTEQTVKIQDCQAVSGGCVAGAFGYDGSCSECPDGEVSAVNSAKIQECYSVNSSCTAGTYGYDGVDCENCPNSHISLNSTVKIQDCYEVFNSCDEGQYGVGDSCTDCPTGEVSPHQTVKIQDCLSVSGDCASGEYGYNGSCSFCPAGSVSPVNTVKVQECYSVNSSCDAGTFGYDGTDCENCPVGQISISTTVKIQDCYEVFNSCDEGQYGVGDACTDCPTGEVSPYQTVKIQDCLSVSSDCASGEYGYNGSCTNCPDGEMSAANASKLQECYPATSSCSAGSYGVNTTCDTCPAGTISSNGAVKIQECYSATSTCQAGEYGVNSDCTPCPPSQTSIGHQTVKIEECWTVTGSCLAGEFGYETCAVCPAGTDSTPGTVKEQDCYVVEPASCEAGQYGAEGDCTECPTGTTSAPAAVKVQECYEEAADIQMLLIWALSGALGAALITILLLIVCIVCLRRRKHEDADVVGPAEIYLQQNTLYGESIVETIDEAIYDDIYTNKGVKEESKEDVKEEQDLYDNHDLGGEGGEQDLYATLKH